MEFVRQRGSIPELKQRPGERDGENVCLAEAGWLASPGIGFRHHGFERFAHWRRLNAVRHRVSPPKHPTKAKGRLLTAPQPSLHPAFFFVELDRARMQRRRQPVLDHVLWIEMGEGGMQLLEFVEVV